MAAIINASTSGPGGIQMGGDASGNLQLQSAGNTMSTISSSGMAINTYTPATSLITSGTAVATTSGTSINFTGIQIGRSHV